MSARVRNHEAKWGSSSEDEDTGDYKYGMKLRELRNVQPPSASENEVTEPRRRGRGPSKRPCLNRNALMARENRQRKKAYLEKIENKLSFYQQENKTLVNTIRKQGIDIKRLTGEVAYLRSVLNNNTSITALLRTINDGLHKIGGRKKNGLTNCPQITQDDSDPHKYGTTTPKENVPKSQNAFARSIGDGYVDYNAIQNQLNGDYHEARKNCKSPTEKKIPLFSEFDHTYTISKHPTVDGRTDPDSRDACNALTTSSVSQASEENYADAVKDLDGIMSVSRTTLSDTDEKKDMDLMNAEFDQMPSFGIDIFEDLPKCDDIINSLDSLQDASSLFAEEDVFHSLDNTGICLHVNSDKVSLEFCSICHSNSKNSGLN